MQRRKEKDAKRAVQLLCVFLCDFASWYETLRATSIQARLGASPRLVQFRQLLDALRMATAVELRLHEDADHARRLVRWDETRADAEHVGIVVLAREPRRLFVPTERRADAVHFVRGNRDADAAAADDDATIHLAVCYGLADSRAEVWIVNTLQAVRALILDLKTEMLDLALRLLFRLKARVVAADGDSFRFHNFSRL